MEELGVLGSTSCFGFLKDDSEALLIHLQMGVGNAHHSLLTPNFSLLTKKEVYYEPFSVCRQAL